MIDICFDHGTNASSFQCSETMTYCSGFYLALDLRNLPTNTTINRHWNDIYTLSDSARFVINCTHFNRQFIHEHADRKYLENWSDVLLNVHNETNGELVHERYIDAHAIYVKIDATLNLYHYFTNFINLFMTLKLMNNTSTQTIMLVPWTREIITSYNDLAYAPIWQLFAEEIFYPFT